MTTMLAAPKGAPETVRPAADLVDELVVALPLPVVVEEEEEPLRVFALFWNAAKLFEPVSFELTENTWRIGQHRVRTRVAIVYKPFPVHSDRFV